MLSFSASLMEWLHDFVSSISSHYIEQHIMQVQLVTLLLLFCQLSAAGPISCAGELGILADDGLSCCPASCEECGGDGCGSRPGGASHCCTSVIKSSSIICGSPPCILSPDEKHSSSITSWTKAALNEECETIGGVLSDDGVTCCPETCGRCGGTDCDTRSGGYFNCCGSGVARLNTVCNVDDPPCVFEDAKINICDYLGGFLAYDGNTCCDGACDSCDTANCKLGLSECCAIEIIEANESCKDNGPPCLIIPAGSTSVNRYISMGLFAGEILPDEREAEYGIGKVFDDRLVFQTVNELDYSEIEDIVSDGRRPILNLEFLTDSEEPVLARILSGEFDSKLKAFAAVCAEKGHEFYIRTLHEHNGNWYPWGLLYIYDGEELNTLEDLSASFQKIIKIFNDANAPVKFQLNINANNGFDDPRPFADFWPDTTGMSSVAITSYNRAYSTPYHQYSLSFYENFIDPYTQVSALTDLPIWVAETGTTSYGTDKPAWIREAYKSIALDFPRVVQFTWFMLNKVNEGKLTDWDLNTDEEVEAFIEGFQYMREITS